MLRALGLALVIVSMLASSVRAETGVVRIAQGFGIGYLAETVMKERRLIEGQAARAGLGEITVEWRQLGSGVAMNEALISDSLDVAAGGTAPLVTVWDKTRRNYMIRGVASLGSMNNYLNTTNPAVHSVKDFTSADRIALPAAGFHHIVLRFAAEQAFGIGQHDKLDPLVLSLSHPDGFRAMMDGNTATANFSALPYQVLELKDPRVHRVVSSYEVMGGPATFLVLWATDRFRTKNPRVYKVLLAALEEATAWINKDKRQAAELYVKVEGGKLPADEIAAMIDSSDVTFTTTPQRTVELARFMARIGLCSEAPSDWRDMFHPEVHDKQGS